jgi:hypothetical protein
MTVRRWLAQVVVLTVLAAFCAAARAEAPYDAKRKAMFEAAQAAREATNPKPPAPEPAQGPTTAIPDFGREPFTVSAWIKTKAGGTIFARTPAKGNWAPDGKTFFVRGGRLCYDIGWVGAVQSQRAVNDGQWHHVAVTGPDTYAFYIDGKPAGQGRLSPGPDVPGHVIRIGYTAENFPSPTAFVGALDEVRLWHKRLSADEVRADFEKPGAAPVAAEALAARWTFDGDVSDAASHHAAMALKGSGATFGEGRTGKALVLGGEAWVDGPALAASAAAAPADLWLNGNFVSLRAAVKDLAATYGEKYPRAADLLARVDTLEESYGRATSAEAAAKIVDALAALRQEALVRENPLLDFGRLLFIKRKTYQSSHYYTDYIDGCKFYGGNLCILSLRDGKVTEVVPTLGAGIFGRFDLSCDATRVVFDYKAAAGKGFRVYEVGVDGTGLRQITFDPPNEQELVRKYRTVGTPTGTPYVSGTDDMHPCYLPCGDIAFITTRCQKGILCDGPDVLTTTVLYRMDKDGKAMRPISFNTVSEAVPSVMQDGRIIYTRWEYVDKGGSACKCIWAMNPDGSGSVEIYGNNITHPTSKLDARDIPGCANAIVFTGAPHMPLGVGSILRADTMCSLRTLEPMQSLTPEIDTPDESGYHHLRGGRWVGDRVGPLFREPYPLSRKYFLVTYNPDRPAQDPTGYGLYLLDEFGNRTLIYKDAESSCWEPYPLRPRPRPPIIPDGNDKSVPGSVGTLVLQDVYTGLVGIERGRVKYLRVMEDVPRPWSARRYWPGDERKQQHVVVSMDGHLAAKVVHGIVPVEADGSAYFQVPADRNVFFQALDENFMELQRMRSFVNLRPGEVRGCVGCHEEKRVAPVADTYSLALRRAPDRPAAQPGDTVLPRTIHYPTDIQPILDKYCVRCHSGPEPKAKMDLTGTMTEQFCRSYENLISRKLAGNGVDEVGAKHGNIESADPLTYGSPTSRLVEVLRRGHNNVKLTREEFVRLVTWIDANAPYYGSYDGRRNVKYKDLPDFRPTPKAGPELAAGTQPAAEFLHP